MPSLQSLGKFFEKFYLEVFEKKFLKIIFLTGMMMSDVVLLLRFLIDF